jgi:anti-sigma regulatory factor (Ser/Thr protein kinase)
MMFTFSAQDILNRDCATEVISAIPADMDEHARFCVRLCLHEALYNAVLHGNLEIKDIHHAGIRQQVEERLKDPILEARPVFVTCHLHFETLEISVKDFGEAGTSLNLDTEEKEGVHGLALIQQLAHAVRFDPEMKELVMHFCWGKSI